MKTIDGLKIPENHAEFAKEVAELADKYGMDRFSMTYRPKYRKRLNMGNRRIHGDIVIRYSSLDGRGRPCKNLYIECEATFSLHIENDPASSS